MSARDTIGAALVLGMSLAVCGVIGPPLATDPWLPLELVVLAVTSAWAAPLAQRLRATAMAGRALARISQPAQLDGLAYSIVPDPAFRAFVLGVLRPRIWLSDASLRALHPAALRAVLLHEEHHRRTRAPLRTAAIEAWMATLGRLPGVGRLLEQRLAQIEIEADAYALRQGARRADLAMALLIADGFADGTAPGAAFTGSAELRVRSLLEPRPGRLNALVRAPLEWSGPGLVALTIVGCHLAWR